MLGSGDNTCQMAASRLLSALAVNPAGVDAMLRCGCYAPLLRLLHSTDPLVLGEAAIALVRIVRSAEPSACLHLLGKAPTAAQQGEPAPLPPLLNRLTEMLGMRHGTIAKCAASALARLSSSAGCEKPCGDRRLFDAALVALGSTLDRGCRYQALCFVGNVLAYWDASRGASQGPLPGPFLPNADAAPVRALIQMLGSDHTSHAVAAAQLLRRLTTACDDCALVSKAGGVHALVQVRKTQGEGDCIALLFSKPAQEHCLQSCVLNYIFTLPLGCVLFSATVSGSVVSDTPLCFLPYPSILIFTVFSQRG